MMPQQSVLITGGNKGIGLILTQKFLDNGFKVVVVARDFSAFTLKNHPNIEPIEYNLANVDGIPQLVTRLPDIDILINNAGVLYGLMHLDYSQEQVDRVIKINLEAPVALITELSKSMIAKQSGRIVNVASVAGQIGHPDVWYGITKAGVINMTKSFAKILGPEGVVVNAVAPGPVETEMLANIPEPRKAAIKSTVYTGRFAYPEEVAAAIYWLATDCPEYINGTCIDINNGAFPR